MRRKLTSTAKGLLSTYKKCLGLSPNLSDNELASVAVDQERLMKAATEADEKKRKRVMHASSARGGSSGAPTKYRMVYTPPRGQLRRPQQQQNWGNLPQFQQWQFQQ
jgi:hypothetical protein